MNHLRYVFVLLMLCIGYSGAQVLDVPFKQAVSVKYDIPQELQDAQMIKTVVDYNNIVYVLTDKGLYRDYGENEISRDLFYRPLSDKNPVDITIQEKTDFLFYLYQDQFLSNAHAGTILADINKPYQRILVNADDVIFLIGEKSGTLYEKTKKMQDVDLPQGKCINAYVYDESFYYLTENTIYRLDGKKWTALHKGESLTAVTFSPNEMVVGTDTGYYRLDRYNGNQISEIDAKLPVPAITDVLLVGSELWFASADGAYLQEPDRYRYFAGRRWLDNNAIIDMACDQQGNMFFLTPTGLNKVEYLVQTLADKTQKIQDDIRRYHLRFGFVCEVVYGVPGDMRTAITTDNDNDGLWTSIYLGSQAFRYAATGDADARRYVWESFEAFERLLTVNPLKGFPSRTFERRGIIQWHHAWRHSQEKDWDWKGTTSTDEYIAYLFVASVMDKFIVQNPEEKQRVANFIDAIMTHIIENDYYFVDYDGKPTRWGRWNPEYVNWYAPYVSDRKLNSVHLIAGLQLAYALTGKEIYKSEAYKMMDEYGYLDNIMIPMSTMKKTLEFVHMGDVMGNVWNHSDDEMSFLTYWVLYQYPFNNDLKQKYVEVIRDHWQIELPERNALWNMVAYGTSGDIDLESTLWHLHEFNVDLDRYTTRNSHRKDLEFLPENFRGQTTKILLYPGEREMHRHNANPFALDMGGGQHSRLAGDEYLLPYWMARYYKVIQ